MKFGAFYAYWERDWETDFLSYVAKYQGIGLDVMELHGGLVSQMPKKDLELLRDKARDANLGITACLGLNPAQDVSSEDPVVRENGKKALVNMIKNLSIAGATHLSGIIYSYWPYNYADSFYKKANWGRAVESLKEVAKVAEDQNIILNCEVVNRFEHFMMNTAAEGVQFCKDVDSPNVKLLLDVFHMNIEEDYIGDSLRLAGTQYMGELHVGECNRKVPGNGHMPWDDIAKALKDINYQGNIVMEPFIKEGGQVGADIKVWRDLSGNATNDQMDEYLKAGVAFLKSKFL